jgi:DNA-binding transcriptional ArsR family regulator
MAFYDERKLKRAIAFLMQPISCLLLTSNHIVAYTHYMNTDKDVIFKALADSTRRLMLDELSERNEMTLYELTARLIMKHNLSISRQAIAKHLTILEDAELVMSKRDGKYRLLLFNSEPLKDLLKRWVE